MQQRAATSPNAAPSGRMTRAELLAWGRAVCHGEAGFREAWRFLGVGLRAIAAFNSDEALRDLLTRCAGAVGLETLASWLAAGEESTGTEVRNDAFEAPERKWNLDRNLSAAGRASGAGALGEGEYWFKARDGNVVRRRRGVWEMAADLRGTARDVVARVGAAGGLRGDIAIEGVDPPWVLREAFDATRESADGYVPRLWVVTADEQEFLDGLSQCDLSDVLASDRVRLFTGPDAAEKLGSDLMARLGEQLPTRAIVQPTTRRPVCPPIEDVLARVRVEQGKMLDETRRRVENTYSGRGRAFWSERFNTAQAEKKPLKVLVPTCRFSTFIRHSAEDLKEALVAAGHQALVVQEPDAHTRLSTLGFLSAIERFEPDLIVSINYTRSTFGRPGAGGPEVIPANIPMVCWIQDSMPHLSRRQVGEAHGELDFVIGHLTPEHFSAFGYPRGRALNVPVAVSARKFHAPAQRVETMAEVAWVSHHSESPAALHDRRRAEANQGGHKALVALIDAMYPHIQNIMQDPVSQSVQGRLRDVVRRTALRLGVLPTPDNVASELVTQVMNTYAMPLADRMFRHQTLGWALEMCRRRGWRLRVFGRGWRAIDEGGFLPRECIGGELTHDSRLAEVYASCVAHLHVSLHALCHQRIMECALSGGFALSRWNADEGAHIRGSALHRVMCRLGGPVEADACRIGERDVLGALVDKHPELAAAAAQLRGVGAESGELFWYTNRRLESLREFGSLLGSDTLCTNVLGDLSQSVFVNAGGLERLVERAINEPRWRQQVSEGIARRVRERLTYDVLVGRLTELVKKGLASR